jgi:hypothetical protein
MNEKKEKNELLESVGIDICNIQDEKENGIKIFNINEKLFKSIPFSNECSKFLGKNKFFLNYKN